MHSPETSTTYVAIDSQVCFYRQLFSNLVRTFSCITGPVGPLGSTNQNWWDVKLLPIAVLIYPVVCVHLCHLLRTQHHYLCPNGWENPPLACPPTPTIPQPLLTHPHSHAQHP